jgi:hypothetical protein
VNDGLEPVTLSKPWMEHAAGDVVRVDPERAAWLREQAYASPAEPIVPAGRTPRRGPKAKITTTSNR